MIKLHIQGAAKNNQTRKMLFSVMSA